MKNHPPVHQSSAEARKSEIPRAIALFRAITDTINNAAVFVVDQDFRYLLAGGNGLRDAGMSPSDFEGRFIASVIPEELLSQYLGDYSSIFAGQVFVREHSVGSRFYRTRGRLIKGEEGVRDVAMAISYDITLEREVRELRRREQAATAGSALDK